MFVAPRLLLGLAAALLIIQRGLAAQPIPAPTLDVLPNGLRVIVVQRHSAKLAAIDLRVRAGAAYETPETNGTAHLIEHLLFKGTTTRKPGEVDAAIESVGGELGANTGKDWAQFATVVPSSAWRAALEVLADAIENPAFRAEDLQIERRVILPELAAAEADPTRAPYAAIARVAFPADHPYGRSLYGPPENIQKLTREDLLGFWRARYTPANMSLVVVGDVTREEIVGAARTLFDAPAAPPAAAPPADLPDPGPIPGVVRAEPLVRDRPLVTVVVGFRAPPVTDVADVVALDVLLQVLVMGGRGRLHDALIRGPEIALAVSADFLTQRAPGLVTLTAVGRVGSEKRLEAALLAEVRRLLAEGVTPGETESARRALLGQTLFDEETFAGEANSLAFYDAIASYEFMVRYRERIAAVTPEDLARVARRCLTPGNYAVATVVPPAPPAAPDQSAEVSR